MKSNPMLMKTPDTPNSPCASSHHSDNNPKFFEHPVNNIRNNSLNGAGVCAKECSPCKGIVF